MQPPGVAPDQAAQAEQTWHNLQKKLAGLSTRGELVIATESGHDIALDQPDLALGAIRRVLEAR